MTKQMLYYEHVVPLSAQRHQGWSLAPRKDYEFAGHSNSVPLTAAEFTTAAAEYAIVFAGAGESLYPSVILGLKPDENRYLDAQGRWHARYVPAYVRRYPFAFSKGKDEDRLILCIDESYAGWNQEGRGKPLFESNAERTAYLNETIKFLEDYQAQAARTQAFCQKLRTLGLLESMKASFTLPSGQKGTLTGFMAIDRTKLQALPGETLAELSRSAELELIYVHLQSLRNLGTILARGTADATKAAPPADSVARDTGPGQAAMATSTPQKAVALDEVPVASTSTETVDDNKNNKPWWKKIGKSIH